MTINFHRWATPSYHGGLPSGYDLINVVSGGTGSSGSAFADGAKSGSNPNTGTYFVAWGEDATSSNANRGLLALAQNTDLLDSLLRQDLAYAVRTNDVTPGSPVSTVVLPTNTFIGTTGYTTSVNDLQRLFEILDSNNDEIIDPTSGQHVQVASVTLGSGDVIGGTGGNGSFSGNTVTLNISPSIPTGVTYRIWYASRTNLATLPMDALTTIKIRTAEEVSAGVENLFRLLHGNNEAWNASWDSTIWDLASGGINERYNHSTTGNGTTPEAYFPTGILNTPGAGSWFQRTGPALSGYSGNSGAYVDPMNALFVSKSVDTTTALSGGNTGFVAFGSRLTGTAFTGESTYVPGAATFMALWPHYFQSAIHATNPYTRILDGATASFSLVGAYNAASGEAIVQVTQSGDYFRTGGNSSVSLGYDLLECTYMVSGVATTRTFVIVAMGSSTDPTNVTRVRVRNLDGTVPNFSTGYTGTIRWMSLSFGVGDGAGVGHAAAFSDVAPVLFDGLFYQVPPTLSMGMGDDNVPRTPASFAANGVVSNAKALQWGGFSYTAWGPSFPSYLGGDGSIQVGSGDVNVTTGAVTANQLALNHLNINFGPGVTAGPWGFVLNASMNGAAITATWTGASTTATATILVENIRPGSFLEIALVHEEVTSGVLTLDWTAGSTSTVTNRFAAGDDQIAPGAGRTIWHGYAISSTEVWWTTTRSSIGLLEAVALLAPINSPTFTGNTTFSGPVEFNDGATFNVVTVTFNQPHTIFAGTDVTIEGGTGFVGSGGSSFSWNGMIPAFNTGLAVTSTGVPLTATALGTTAAVEAVDGPIQFSGANAVSPSGTPLANAIYGSTFDKMQANVSTDGSGGHAVNGTGLNCAIALATEPVHSHSAIHVAFATDMEDGNYLPSVQVIGWYGTITAIVSSPTAAGFYVTFWQFQQASLLATGADVLIDPATTPITCAIRVAGTQP